MAERIGAGRHGISFSICKSGAVDPVFSDNFDCEYRDWSAIRAAPVNGLQLLGHYFPHRMECFLAPPRHPLVLIVITCGDSPHRVVANVWC